MEVDRFDAWVAAEIRASKHGYFGNLRGTNEFADVDCLIVLGRHRIGDDSLLRYGEAIYGAELTPEKAYADIPVRMQSGSSMSLSNFVFKDERLQNVYSQFCSAETIQAIGRGRLVHGKPKDVYLFSNESLGPSVEIERFFDFEHDRFGDKISIPDNCRCIESKRASLLKIGFSEHDWKNSYDEISKRLLSDGFNLYDVTYKTSDYKSKESKFFARNANDINACVKGEVKSIQEVYM